MITAVLGGILGAITQLLGFFVALLGTVTSLLLELAVQILNAVISTGLISLSYTNPAGNPFIAVGWELTRGLTNIIFVVALLAIGLGTALKINDYQAKKALPLLIVIALLINFTPVILGVIVDASNIIMNYFLGSGFQGGSVLLNQVSGIWTTFTAGFGEFWNPAKSVNTLMSLLVINVFNVVAAFIFFIFAAIFLMRYVVIWLLVILSPIAFACYILPATRSVFKKWWTQFIQWTFVGAIAGFFLYLANQLMKLILIDKAVVFTSQEGQGLGLLNYILPWFVIIIFLILGLQTALSSSAQGASLATNFAQKAGKVMGGFAARQTLGRALATERGTRWMKALEETKLGPSTLKDWKKAPVWKKVLSAVAAPIAYPTRWGARKLGAAGLQYGAAQTPEIDKRVADIQKKFGKDYIRAAATYNDIGPMDYQGKIAMAHYLTKNKGGKGFSQLNDDQKREVIKLTSTYDRGRLDDIVKYAPNMIDDKMVGKIIQNTLIPDGIKPDPTTGKYLDSDVATIIEENEKLGKPAMSDDEVLRKAAYKKAVDAMKDADLAVADPSLIDNKEFREAVARWKPWSFVRKIAEEWGGDMIEKIQTSAEEIGLESIARTNPAFVKISTTPAGEMFMRKWKEIKTGATDKETRERVNEFVANATRAQIKLPANMYTVESDLINNLANARFVADPSKNLTEHISSVEKEYKDNFRKIILSKMHEPKMEAVRSRLLSMSPGQGTLIWEDMFKDIAERQLQESSLRTITPKPTSKEIKEFQDISRGTKMAPSKPNLANLRKVQGALRVSHFTVKKQYDEIAERVLNLQNKRTAPTPASPAEISALENEINTMETNLRNTKATEMALKSQEVRIKSRLKP